MKKTHLIIQLIPQEKMVHFPKKPIQTPARTRVVIIKEETAIYSKVQIIKTRDVRNFDVHLKLEVIFCRIEQRITRSKLHKKLKALRYSMKRHKLRGYIYLLQGLLVFYKLIKSM